MTFGSRLLHFYALTSDVKKTKRKRIVKGRNKFEELQWRVKPWALWSDWSVSSSSCGTSSPTPSTSSGTGHGKRPGELALNHSFKLSKIIFWRLIERARARIVDSKTDEITIEPLPIESKMKVFFPILASVQSHHITNFLLCRISCKMHPRKSTRWKGFSSTRARYTRTGNAWVRDKFSGSLRRNKKAGKCSQSFIWANIPGRHTQMSPFKQRVLERVFGN